MAYLAAVFWLMVLAPERDDRLRMAFCRERPYVTQIQTEENR